MKPQELIHNWKVAISRGDVEAAEQFKNEFKNNNLNFNNFVENVKVDFIWNSLIFNLYENQLNLNIQEVNGELELMKKEKKNNKKFNL